MRPTSRSAFTIVIICALPLEADAIECLFDETYDRFGRFYGKQLGDTNSYVNGRLGEHNVVLCYLPGMGKESAASASSSLRVTYTGVRLALVVGICGGAPRRPSSDTQIFLGDVIISDEVVEYYRGGEGSFQRNTDVKDILSKPDRREIRSFLTGLMANRTRGEFQNHMLQYLHTMQQSEQKWQYPDFSADVLYEASHHHKHYNQSSSPSCRCFDGDSPEDICEAALEQTCNSLGCDMDENGRHRDGTGPFQSCIHVGKVASGGTVMKSGKHRDQIVTKESVIGFEMEGAGVCNKISCIIIKGVCDYADSHKSKA